MPVTDLAQRQSLNGFNVATCLHVIIDRGVATVTLDDPDSAVNTVSPAWIDEMTVAFQSLKENPDVRGIIVLSGKPGFMAGADLNFILKQSTTMNVSDAVAFSQQATRLHRLIETCGKPVVAAMTGFALGGGYELALACTYRILADDPKAVVGLPEVNVGLLPGSGGTQRLPRLIGLSKASDVLLEGKTYAPPAALELGLVDLVVPAEKVIDSALTWLASRPSAIRPWDRADFKMPESDGLMKQSTATFFTLSTGKLLARYGSNYPAPIAILSCLFEGVQVPIDKGLMIESRHFAHLMTGSVARNIIRTTFVSKGLAEKGARRPKEVPNRSVSKLGVLGAGMMGAGIAFVAAKSRIEVVLLDTTLELAERGKDSFRKILDKDLERGKISRETAELTLARIKPTADYSDLAGVDLVVEAVFEDTAIKAAVTQRAAHAIGPDVILATNTSTLPINQLADSFGRPADFIGLHFFSPVDRMSLVEVIMGKRTSPVTLARALDFVAQLRKTPIVVNDSRGFYTSRVFQTFIHEGMELLREGVAPALIENAARLAGMPLGPLAVTDETTLELPMKIIRQTEREDKTFCRPKSMAVLEKMVDELGRPGRKAGGGFYEYPVSGKKRLWEGLATQFPVAIEQPDVETVKRRLLYIQSLETVRCLEENVLTHRADGDLGSVLGWGFPAWSGGTLGLIETVGVAEFVATCEALALKHGSRFTPTTKLRDMARKGGSFNAG